MSKEERERLARMPNGAAYLDNKSFTGNLALRPGMTANVSIQTRHRENVLKVPATALRFNPSAFVKDDKKASMNLAQAMSGGARPGGPGGGGMMGRGAPGANANGPKGKGTKAGVMTKREDRLWVLENGVPKPIVVKAGITDGSSTEVTGEGIHEGMEVLVGVEDTKKSAAGAAPSAGSNSGGSRR